MNSTRAERACFNHFGGISLTNRTNLAPLLPMRGVVGAASEAGRSVYSTLQPEYYFAVSAGCEWPRSRLIADQFLPSVLLGAL